MINYETPDLIKNIHNKIKDEELYIEEDNDDYGKETESHVTKTVSRIPRSLDVGVCQIS